MNNINVPNEIKKVENELMTLDMDILNVAREEVKRKANIKDMTARVLLITIIAALLGYAFFTISSFLNLILDILYLFVFTKFGACIISAITSESIKKKLDDLEGLRSISKKLAKKNPELAKKISDKECKKQILDYLNERYDMEETEFTSIKPMVQGELRGPQELVNVLTRILEKKEKYQ